MREILFRAQRKDNGEWVEGFYSQLPKPSLGATIITNGDLCAEDVGDYIIVNRSRQHSNFSNAFPIEVVECEYYEIDPETLCQYTGLKDKNGNRIWENDIVDTYEESSKEHLINVVKFENGCFKVFKKHYLPMYLDAYSKRDLITIGNIFDNPELMKGE